MSSLALLFPLIGALLVAIAPATSVARWVAVGTSASTFVIALLLPGSGDMSFRWIPGIEAYFALSPEGARSVLVAIAALVMTPTVAWAGWRVAERPTALMTLLLLMQAGLNGVFLATDLVLFYLFWEATLIPSLLMLGMWGGPLRRQATLKYLMYAVASSFVMLVSILALRPLSGAASYRFDDLLAAVPLLDGQTQTWLFVGFALACAVKLPMWPLHSWLPDFHEQNHPSGVADVAGTLYKVGGWGFFAWVLPLLPHASQTAAPVLLALCAFTALYAAIVAITQRNLKRLLAYASLSHMGIVGAGIFGLHASGMTGGVYLLAAQMASTGGLFLLSGMLYERRRTFDITAYGGLAKSAPALAAVTLFALFASIGVPGLANFPGELMSLLGAYQANPFLGFVATSAVVAAGIYGVNTYQRLFQAREEHGPVPDLHGFERLVLVPIVVAILWLGITPYPQLERIDRQSQVVRAQLEAHPVPVADASPEPAAEPLVALRTPGGER